MANILLKSCGVHTARFLKYVGHFSTLSRKGLRKSQSQNRMFKCKFCLFWLYYRESNVIFQRSLWSQPSAGSKRKISPIYLMGILTFAWKNFTDFRLRLAFYQKSRKRSGKNYILQEIKSFFRTLEVTDEYILL